MEWSDFADRFLASRREAGASTHTLAAYAADMAAFATWYTSTTGQAPEPAAVTPLDVTEYRALLQRRAKPATVNRRVGTVKTAFGWAAAAGLLAGNPAAQVRPVQEVDPGPRAVDRRVLGAFLREAQRAGSVRDVCLVTLLAQAGFRISEALALRWGDVTTGQRSGQVTVRRGKGEKWREVPLSLTARRALAAWRDARWPDALPTPDAAVFPGRDGLRPLSARAVQQAFVRYTRRAGIESPLTPHTLRHAFCKALVDEGVSLDRVGVLAGHCSLQTTARYTRPTRADLERAVERLEWI